MYSNSRVLLNRVAKGGLLNSPWGIALAPDGFGNLGGDLLIGNFGDGRINGLTPAFRGGFLPIGSCSRPAATTGC